MKNFANRNKIIDIILIIGAAAAVSATVFVYLKQGDLEVRGIVVAVSCILAIKKPGKMMPPYTSYQQHYDFLQGNVFRGREEQQMVRKAFYFYNIGKYKKAIRVCEKLLQTRDLLSNEREIVISLKRAASEELFEEEA